jgi:hypothetical protein
MNRRIPISVAAALLSLWLPSHTLAAQPDPSLRPVAITAAAGTIAARVSPIPVLITDANETTGHIRVDNTSSLVEDVTIDVADYSIDAAGQPVPAPADFPFGSARWYLFETPAFSLPAGMGRDIPFNLVIPAGSAAGDHFAALNVTVQAQPGQVELASGSASARSVLVFQSRLQHRIDGAQSRTPTVGLTARVESAVHFTARVGNPGNTVLGHQAAPTPTLRLYDLLPWGDPVRVARTIPVSGFYVAPRAVRDVSVEWTDVPLIGRYRAVFVLPAADGQPEVIAETTLTIVNVPIIGGAALALVLGLLAVLFLAIRRRPGRRQDLRSSPA